MDNYKKGNKFGGGKKFGGGGRKFGGDRGGRSFGGGGGGRGGDRPDMHKAVCTDCGNNCEVPFRPTGEKPIFCSDCFKGKRDDNPRGSRDRSGRDSKPRFVSKTSNQGGANKDTTNYKAQFEMLNTKLNTIIKALAPADPKESKDIIISKAEKIEKSEKTKKAPKKGVDKASLKKAVKKTAVKKPAAKKKVVVKKKVTKKKK